MPQKEVFLRAFEITTPDPAKSLNIYDPLLNKLQESKSVNERRLKLNEESLKEDLLSYFQDDASKKSLFCTMVRANIGNEVRSITEELFKEKSFPLSKLKSKSISGAASIYDFSYYFVIIKNILITNLSRRHTISSTQTYLNWLLGETKYEITPLISEKYQVELSAIDNLTFDDNFLRSSTINTESSTSLSLPKNLLDQVKNLFVDAKSLDQVNVDQLISAKLIVKFRKNEIDKISRVQNTFGAVLKPIADLDNVTIRTRDNKKLVKGSELQKTTVVKIGVLDDGLLEEPSLFQAMTKFGQAILKERNENESE